METRNDIGASRDPYTPPTPPPRNANDNKRPWLLLLLILVLIAGIVLWNSGSNTGTAPGESPNGQVASADRTGTDTLRALPDTTRTTATNTAAPQRDVTCIAGLTTEEVLSGLRQRNFRIDTLGGGSYQCVRSAFGADYQVTVRADGGSCVHSVNAWVKADGLLKSAQATQDFFHYFADLAYDGARPDSAYDWFDENSTLPKASTVLSGARFTMALPERTMRTLELTPEGMATAKR